MAEAARAFGFRHLSTFAKALYFSRAIEMYNQIFRDGQGFVASLTEGDMGSLDRLLAAMKGYSTKQVR